MNNMVMIGESWFNLDQFVVAHRCVDSYGNTIIDVDKGMKGFFRVDGDTAVILWEHMKKHSYNIALEEE